ncbi:MAG: histidine kinase dimerization/phospho-acceptor domain-containing protein, partial [Bacteroidota bacterium]
MFSSKNPTPKGISFIIALVSALLIFLIVLLVNGNLVAALVSGSIGMGISFFLAQYLITEFVERKIKLIYKFIHQTKASKREEFYLNKLLPKQSIDEVGEEVLQWADQRKAEMEVLERNEAFRKEFLQNLSHEFKTPAFAIQGYLETLIAGASENPEVRTRFLN